MSPEERERTLAAETKTNNKGSWNYVNSRRKTRTNIADLRTNQGAFTSDDLEKADIFSTGNMQIPLLAIIYKYIDKGTLPSQWKEAIVTLIWDASRTIATTDQCHLLQ